MARLAWAELLQSRWLETREAVGRCKGRSAEPRWSWKEDGPAPGREPPHCSQPWRDRSPVAPATPSDWYPSGESWGRLIPDDPVCGLDRSCCLRLTNRGQRLGRTADLLALCEFGF